MVVAGIDGGGTKTECWVADLEGRVLGRGVAAGANVLATERAALCAALRECLHRALADAGREEGDLRAVCLALAGYWPGRASAPTPQDLAGIFPEGTVLRLEPDVHAALQSAVGGGPGVALIAGTGSIAFGRRAQGATARAGGWGHLLGDEGSAYWIGLRAVHAALRSADGREEATVLARTIPGALGCASPADMVPLAYQCQAMGKREVSALAPLVTEAAAAGDPVATRILHDAAQELALLVAAVARPLGLEGEAFPVVATGGVFRAGGPILEPLRAALASRVPGARLSQAEVRPAWGAALLAIQAIADCPSG